MRGYDKSKLIDIEKIKDKSYFHSALLAKAERVFLDTKKNPGIGVKSFSPPKFKEYLPKDQEGVLLNAMQLHNYKIKSLDYLKTKILSLL